MPLTPVGQKPVILAEVTRIWLAARHRVRFAALRCPDFYGPHVQVSHLGVSAFGELAKGKAAQIVVPVDIPYDFTDAPNIARAVISLFDAPDDAFGQARSMPCAPIRTLHEIFKLGADAIEQGLKLMTIPCWLLPLAGVLMRFMKEGVDVGFTWDRPYHLDASKFKRCFWSDVPPF
jgi:nucleoside-diphosphate-sugar epimerase